MAFLQGIGEPENLADFDQNFGRCYRLTSVRLTKEMNLGKLNPKFLLSRP
jgi:hypothetical protein